MDNVTHTLIGALLGETVARTTHGDPRGLSGEVRRNLLVTTSAIGSNLPDIDVLYSFIGDKINYLLQHRGHSHTVIGALLLAIAAFAIARWLLARRGHAPSSTDLLWLAGVLAITPLLHIGMDFTNNYGVHPFWPLSNRWFYGDAVFIAEPLLWAACAPLSFTFRSRTARAIVGIVLASGIALGVGTGFVPLLPAIVLVFVTAAMVLLASRLPAHVSLTTGIVLWIAVTATFVAASQVAAHRADRIAASFHPTPLLFDHVLTPMPANPLCWEVMLVQLFGDEVLASRAMVALVPDVMSAEQCLSRSLDRPTTAPLGRAIPWPATNDVKWYGQVTSSQGDLRHLWSTDCEAAAALRFIRVPWLADIDGKRVLGDLRYDREPSLGFAELELHSPPAHCPGFVPPWEPPRADLLLQAVHPLRL